MADEDHRHRAEPVAVAPTRHRRSRADRKRAERHRRRRRIVGGIALSLLVVVVVAAVFLGSKLWRSLSGADDDYTGNGKRDVVIQVQAGDSTTAVGETLLNRGVVRTVRAFVDAAHGNAAISSIQPGFYRMRTEIPAANAVARLADPKSRVGKLVIPEGRQLDDTTDMKSNVVNPGILTLISRATCVNLDGNQRCVSVADLRTAASKSTPVALQVPPWAVEPVNELGDDHRRIEGLIAPGTFNIDPSASAETILATLINAGAVAYMKSGLVDTAKALSLSPYDILVVASLVQQEANAQDFSKVAQVIYNRLHEHRTLEFDSTVNYPLDRREVATSDGDRGLRTPWNTYMSEGLPATAICSPGVDALRAAEHPEPGDWLYFVTIDSQGTTLFTRDYQQHLANIELAKRNGVLDSAR
ncbi:membrane protein [Mycobacterium kubicae]|uniref:Endolytic murein transglycosylase n=1 Tax=Mycobacterium kubicae TaxID=120959 RepID=A0AAX1JEH2_9MYCO|nr:endolytic transglycosylase MltG [Mycobacterium kubicae]MCV7097235.1 endolytic transglycosylase MltG [Mycobacterium kubicae]OBF18090.1 aminodeoxychorismate lyase [Mycobacterium kubicae]ORW03929.1 aminodeoxychorismate lyase [Mycobacterium kubicae]QNI06622.1 endolytic transglycosylase MltG [Mycobacterium kubicae]QNI11627.1 endolytic transglycosylase MltG [Mycobacterium kubicae]